MPSLEQVGGVPGGAAIRSVLEVGHNEDGSNADVFRLLGFKAINHDPRTISTSHQGTTQIVHGNLVVLQKGDVISNVGVYFTTAGAALTLCKVGIYDKNLNLVAASANDATFGAAAGYHDLPLTTPFVVPATDIYYLADLYVGTTMPFYLTTPGGPDSAISQMPLAGAQFLFFQQLGQADLPAVATPIQSQHSHLYYAK